MAAFTLTLPSVFPEGTKVGAYPASNWPARALASGKPAGAATETATVTSGSAAFVALATSTDYYAAAEVGGVWRYVSFRTAIPSEGSPIEREVLDEEERAEAAESAESASRVAAIAAETASREASIYPNAKTSGGTKQFGIPGAAAVGLGTAALEANVLRYVPFRVEKTITVSAFQFELTVGPAAAAKIRVGIYKADADLQPTGAALLEKEVEVAKEATGVKATTGLSVKLEPGVYLVVTNCSAAMTLRTITTPTPVIAAAMGANGVGKALVKEAVEYGAFAGTKWASVLSTNAGAAHAVVFQWA